MMMMTRTRTGARIPPRGAVTARASW